MGHMQLQQHRTTVQYTHKTENKRWFQASGTGAGGLVAPLLCTAYFNKLAILFGCSLLQQAYRRRPSPLILYLLVSQPE